MVQYQKKADSIYYSIRKGRKQTLPQRLTFDNILKSVALNRFLQGGVPGTLT